MKKSNKILLRKLAIGLTPVLMGTLMVATPTPVKAEAPQKAHESREQGKQAHTVTKQLGTANHSDKKELPRTGAKQDIWTAIGLAETVVALLFGKAWKHDKD